MIAKSNTKLVYPTLAGVEFLRSELLTGLTLTKIARDANHSDKSNRNRVNARKAYDSILRFMPKVNLSGDEVEEIKSKLQRLKSELALLGEEI